MGLLAAGLWLAWTFVVPALRRGDRPEAPPPPVPAAAEGLSDADRLRLREVDDVQAAALFREMLETVPAGPAREELRVLRTERARAAVGRLAERVETLAAEFRYTDARRRIDMFTRLWAGTGVDAELTALGEALDERQRRQIDARVGEAEQLLAAGRYEAARETLRTDYEFEPTWRAWLTEQQARIERRIRVAQHTPTAGTPSGPAPATGPGAGGPTALAAPPPLPGLPHPDVERLAEAREMVARARELLLARRWEPAARVADEIVGYFPDLSYVRRRRDGIDAIALLARHGAQGAAGLFHAAEQKVRGARVTLRYRFTAEDELLDWEELPTIPHADEGRFEAARDGVRGTGVMSLIHRGFFSSDVRVRCTARIGQPRTHGLGFCQQDLETRQILLLATNHWFVEGENYVLERPGHSLLMIGKGTNADVPVDSPDIGFIFVGPTVESPNPPPDAALELSFSLKGTEMTGRVAYRGDEATLRGTAVGDDGRGIERVRPALLVLQNSVVFSEVEIEGVLHPTFERARVAELLRRVEALR